MIFGLEDVILLSRTAARKSLELAGLPYRPGTSPAKAALLADMLVRDLNRIHLMADIASDNLAGIGERLDSLPAAEENVADGVQGEYLAGLGAAEIADETGYWKLVPRLLAMVPYLRRGLRLSEVILSGDSPLGDARAAGVIRARKVLLELYSKGESIGEEALECVKVLVVLCSQLLRVHSGRDVETNEISELLRASGMFDPGEFRSRLTPLLDGQDAETVGSLLDDRDLHLAVLCGRAVSNSVIRGSLGANDS